MSVHKFIKIIVLPALFCALLTPLSAQRNLNQIDQIMAQEELQLTDSQIEDLQDLKAAAKERKAELRNLDKDERRAEAQAMREEYKDRIHEILTEEQIAYLTEKRTAKKEAAEERKAQRKSMKEELKAYHQEHVKPVVTAQRAKLESNITPEDRQAIEDFRTAFKAAKKEGKTKAKANAEQGRKKHKGKKRMADSHMRTPLARYLRQNDEAKATAQDLVSRYEDQIQALEAEIADQRAQWKADNQAIIEKYRSDEGRRQGRDRSGSEEWAQKKEEHKKFMAQLGFLLMDPNKAESSHSFTPNPDNLHQLRAYPNPATQTQTLELLVSEPGQVKVELVDRSGKTVRSVFTGQMDAGTHSLQVDISGLQDDIFFYRVSDASGVSSQQAVIGMD